MDLGISKNEKISNNHLNCSKSWMPLNLSEHPEKVCSAINNVIDNCHIDSKHGRIVGTFIAGESLNTIYEHINHTVALGVLRKALLDNRITDATWFLLNKQSAVAGTVVLVENKEESPLGAIKVTLECDELETVIDWLAPLA